MKPDRLLICVDKWGAVKMIKSYMFPAIIVTSIVAAALLAYALLLPVSEDEVVIEGITQESIIEAPEESQQTVITATNETDNSLSKPASPAALPELIVDIARVQPDGMAVFAGKGAAGGTIFITENGEILAQNAIDQQGQWVVLPEKPLSPGAHLLELQMVTKDGLTVRADISLVVEISQGLDQKPLVAVVPQTDEASPVLLQAPEEVAPTIIAEGAQKADSKAVQTQDVKPATDQEMQTVAEILGQEDIFIQIGSLSWQSDTRLAIHGVASGGDFVDGMIGNMPLNKVSVPQNNRWSIIVDGDPFAAADNQLITINLRGENDDILASTELMMNKNQLKAGLDGSLMVVVHKGDALWRIAYRSYGQGVRYVDIFKRNADKINDPDLIYPNQIFAVPGVKSQTNDN